MPGCKAMDMPGRTNANSKVARRAKHPQSSLVRPFNTRLLRRYSFCKARS